MTSKSFVVLSGQKFHVILPYLILAIVFCFSACGDGSSDTKSANTGNSPPLNPPSAPAGVKSVPGDKQITVSWNAVSGAGSYNIYWSVSPGVTKSSGTKIPNVSSPFTHSGRTNGTPYYYAVTSVNGYGESSMSNETSAVPFAGGTNPLTGNAVKITYSSAMLQGSFTNPTGYTTSVWFEYGTDSSYGTTTPLLGTYSFAGPISVSSGIAGLQGLSEYHFRIVTQNSAGTFTGEDKSFVTPITPELFLPGLVVEKIAVDSENVYFPSTGPSIQKVSVNGGTPEILASGQIDPDDIVVDSANVYWTDNDNKTVQKVDKNGGAITTLASGLNYPSVPVVDSTSVYFRDGETIKKVGINGGAVTTLATNQKPVQFVTDSENLYWIEPASRAIKKISKNGGTVITALICNSFPKGMAVDSEYLYWTEPGTESVRKMNISDSTITTIATGLKEPTYIALDSSNVYIVASFEIAIKKVSKNGGTVKTLALLNYGPVDFALGTTSVFWISSWDRYIYKVPKDY
jgi:hypothetical protein